MRHLSRMAPVLRRVALITAGLLVPTVPSAAAMGHRYGRAAAARFAFGSVAGVLAQQTLVAVAAKRNSARLTWVDAMTLSRGLAAALLLGLLASGVRHRSGLAGWMGFGAMVYGSIVCDWLDGPIARRMHATSDLGALLDLESDSWLTLAAAASATAWGGLPAYCRAAPMMRYVLLLAALGKIPYSEIYAGEPSWARQTGIAQGALFTAALAPFGGRATRLALRLATPIVAPLQLMVMMLLHRRLRRRQAV
jgi:phosphatidylglycerophosphate synthase